MIFHEIYGSYYNAVAAILKEASEKQLTSAQLRNIVEKYAFGESSLSILPALQNENWSLMKDGKSILKCAPSMPLTTLQKRWLKSICTDPRVRLFGISEKGLENVEPLFLPNDFQVFDRFLDGDPYENEEYIAHFRVILQALKNQTPVRMGITNRLGKQVGFCFIPEALEYSEKNDKFRVVAQVGRRRLTINLAKIEYCRHFHGEYVKQDYPDEDYKRTVVIELKDDRNALERIMMAFSYYEKEAEKIDETTYRLRIIYDVEDETEVLIQLLSFGPVLKVVEPESFIKLIKDRLLRQKSCEL